MISIYNTIILLFLAIGSSAKVTIGEAGVREFDASSVGRYNFSATPSSSARYTKSRTSSNSTTISSATWLNSSSLVVSSTKILSTRSDTSSSSTSSFRLTTTIITTLSTSSTTHNSSTLTSSSGGGSPGGGPHGGGGPGGGGGHSHKHGHSKGHHHGGGPPGGGPPPSDNKSSTSKKSSTTSSTTSSSDTSSSTSSSTASACPLPTRTSSSVISTTSDSSNVQRDLQPTETPGAGEHNLEKRKKTKASFTMITRQDPSSKCLLSTAIKYPQYPGPGQVVVYEGMPTPRPDVVQNILDTMPRWYVVRHDPDPLALPAFTVVDTAGLKAAGPGGGPVYVGGQTEPSVNIDHIWEKQLLPSFIGDQLDDNSFDCNDLKTIFLAIDATGFTRLQTFAQLVASKQNPELLGVLTAINNLKGVLFDGNTLLSRHMLSKGSVADAIAELQAFIIMFDIFREQRVIDLFKRTNERIYMEFQAIDELLSDQCIRRVKNKKPLNPTWAEGFKTYMDQQLTKANDVAYTFASKYSSTISEALAAQATEACPPPDLADNQRNLDILTQNDLFSQAQLSFDFGLTYPAPLKLKSGCSCRCLPCLPCFCSADFDLDDDASMNMTESTSITCSTSTTLATTTTSSTTSTSSTSTSCDPTLPTGSPMITFNVWGDINSCYSSFVGTWEFANPGCCMNMSGQGWGAFDYYQDVNGCTLYFYTDSLCQEGESGSFDQVSCYDTSQYNSVQLLCS